MTRSPRVAVTGVGVVSAWGWGAQPFWSGLCSGRSAIGPFDRFDHARYRTHVAAQVPAAPRAARGAQRGWAGLSQADRFALAAAGEALEQAGLPQPLGDDAGVFFSSCTAGMFETETYYARLCQRMDGRARLAQLASQQASAPGNAVARRHGVGGPVTSFSSACASGSLAIGQALEALRDGTVSLALAGGADSLCRVTYGGFNALRSVDAAGCRPFQRERAGLSLGEGGAVLVLEPLAAALARGATPLALLAGSGASNDAHHMTAPHPEGRGARVALESALADAGLAASAIDFLNAHGTGTPLNDRAEWRALRDVFGPRLERLPITSTKAGVGHLLGSAGAIEAAATVLCLLHGRVHPTAGEGELDPELPLDLVRGAARAVEPLRAAASLNLGFGGCNAALILTRADDDAA